MSKTTTTTMKYDASLDQVTAMLMDPAFRTKVLQVQEAVDYDVSIVDGEVDLHYSFATKGLPGFAKKVVGDSVKIEHHETWSTPTNATLKFAIPGKPGSMTGTVALSETNGVVSEVVTLTVTVNIPLVAGKIESLIGDMLTKALKAEYAVGQRWLA